MEIPTKFYEVINWKAIRNIATRKKKKTCSTPNMHKGGILIFSKTNQVWWGNGIWKENQFHLYRKWAQLAQISYLFWAYLFTLEYVKIEYMRIYGQMSSLKND